MAVETPPTSTQRSLGRWHLSTHVFTAAVLVALIIQNIAGHLVAEPDLSSAGKIGPHFEIRYTYEHGWPLSYLISDTWSYFGKRYRRVSQWNVFRGVRRFNQRALLVDLSVCLGVVLVVGAMLESVRRRRSKFFQFRLSSCLLFVAVIAVPLAVHVFWRSQHRHELDILKSIEKTRDPVEWGRPIDRLADWQPGPFSWLRESTGGRLVVDFDRVVGIDVTGDELERAVKLRHLKRVAIINVVSNRQLKRLEELPALQALDLSMARGEYDSRQDTEEFFQIPRLPNLRSLNLYETHFRGDGLQNTPHLEVLDLTDTEISDEALAQVAKLVQLTRLLLGSTRITDRGVAHLGNAWSVEGISLG